MNTKLLKSVASLAIVVALGVGGTYAAFTSNTVTISGNQMATGSAEIKICDQTAASQWTTSISPNMILSGLTPGASDQELTVGKNIFVGNDSGALADNGITPGCVSYVGTPGSSDISLVLVPKITSPTCPTSDDLDDQFSLKFQFNGANETPYMTLNQWFANTDDFGPTIAPDGHVEITAFGKLDAAASEQGENCTFDITFFGEQAV